MPRKHQIIKYVASLNNDDIFKKHFILTETEFQNELFILINREGWKVVEVTPEGLMDELRQIEKGREA